MPRADQLDADYNACIAAQKAKYDKAHRRAIINALAKGCFLRGINQTLGVTLMQKNQATLTEVIKEAMQLELINETTSAKNKIASLADLEDANL